MVERLPGLASARKGSELKGGSLPDSHRWMGVSCFAENILKIIVLFCLQNPPNFLRLGPAGPSCHSRPSRSLFSIPADFDSLIGNVTQ